MKIVSSVTFNDEYKILKTKSRIMAKSLRTLKMLLFFRFLRNSFAVLFNYNVLEKELLEYIELNRNKVQYVLIDEFKKWLKELRKVIDRENIIKKELRKEICVLKSEKEDEINLLERRLRMDKILMKDNDKYECFQYTELDEIKEKSRQEVDKINKLIRIKEWNITDSNVISKFKDYKRDVQEELDITEIILENLKVLEERLDELRSQYLERL